MRNMKFTLKTSALILALAMALNMTVLAAQVTSSEAVERFKENKPGSQNGGWSNNNNLTWEFFDGDSFVIGTGPKFCDIHPEISDPEYYLKQDMLYPGEAVGALNDAGITKSNYTEGSLSLLQQFVNSFDWIHMTELDRLKVVHDRISMGRHGNRDEYSGETAHYSFPVLEKGIGGCGNYAGEFRRLASYVGLEATVYTSSRLHEACLVKINGQWLRVDPFGVEDLFDNGVTFPVDFETEYNRYDNEVVNSESFQNAVNLGELQKQAEAGLISWTDYYLALYPGKSIEEIKEMYRNWGVELQL